MPFIIGDPTSIPDFLCHWTDTIMKLVGFVPKHRGEVGYFTLDEKMVVAGTTHRRAGLHVDGAYRGGFGGWGGGGGGWGGVGNGMLTTSNVPGCRAWNQMFDGRVGMEGECDHFASQTKEESSKLFGANEVYWVDGACVHESVPMVQTVNRQFVRVSLPSNAPWFEGYTVNPLGVTPTGPILERRPFMDM